MAEVIFKVSVVWINQQEPSPDDLTLKVCTYTGQEGVGLLDSEVMEYVNTENGISYYRVQFNPNTSAVYWGVDVQIEDPLFWVVEGNPAFDNDPIDYFQDNTFQIHIDD